MVESLTLNLFLGKLSENSPTLTNTDILGSITRVFCIYVINSWQSLWFECSVHVSDGNTKKLLILL